jgi:hypothetical protein
MSQAQKDFLALSHGQEWVTFYESFDKLVQDNLSRSSELLRRAMALPEVADREVQQIRTEMEGKLSAERTRQREVLSALREDITGSHRQVSMLARSVGAVIGDLERLSQRVNEAISSFDADAVAPAVEAKPPVVANGAVYSNGSAPAAPAAAYAPPVQIATLPTSSEIPVFAELEVPIAGLADFSLPAADDLAVDFSVEEINAAVEEQHAMLAAAEQQLDNLEAAIDLSALAEAEVEPTAEAPAPAADAAPAGEQRPRPHWLSVTRTGGKQ